jgi:diguanylate cyclase (GGDEF)-like protein
MDSIVTNLSIVRNQALDAAKAANLQHYDISSALQTTLDFKEIISIFSEKIQDLVPHSGLSYQIEQYNLLFNKGITTRYACNYTLSIEQQNLGELTLMRQKPFTEEDLSILETLLCCLIYPLKNACLYQQAINMAHTDPLTQVQNRTAFNDAIQREYSLSKRNQQPLSLIFADIDHFKQINDRYSHACGDFALTSIANWITESIRDCDIVFRYGGEEFVILLSNTGLKEAVLIAERIRQTIMRHTLAYEMKTISLTASLGVSSLADNESADDLIKRADQAMYQAKKQGRNQVVSKP